MAYISGSGHLVGNAQGEDDRIFGSKGDDKLEGLSGDDYLWGSRGEDTLIGGRGSDVMKGGLDGDTFEFSAGHIENGDVDYIIDFSIDAGDKLKFLDSGDGQIFEVLSIVRSYLTITEFKGRDLENNVELGTDITFTVRNSGDGNQMEIVLFDAWSGELDSLWQEFLSDNGWSFTV
jgi:hypothetical protein